MDQAIWFYKKGKHKKGPVSHRVLEHLLEEGMIDASTPVWSESLGEWTPIGELEHFNMNTLDDTPTIVIEHEQTYVRETGRDTVRGRPWVRFWARMLDYSFLTILLGGGILGLHLRVPGAILGFAVPFLWIFIEAALIATWGTTPGKWFLKTWIRGKQDKRLSGSHALNRSFSVWWMGLGAGLPIISLITMIVAGIKVSNSGQASWDHSDGYQVHHGKIGALRVVVVVCYFLIYGNIFISQGFIM